MSGLSELCHKCVTCICKRLRQNNIRFPDILVTFTLVAVAMSMFMLMFMQGTLGVCHLQSFRGSPDHYLLF
jgi:hypothetical protein